MSHDDGLDQTLPARVTDFLAADPRIERCPADHEFATQVAESVLAQECEDALHAASQARWRKANTYLYDGARKVVEAILLAEGWRVRPVAGAHAAVVEIIERWLADEPDPGPRIARSFGTARKARHDDEYPSPTASDRTVRELRALAQDSARVINACREHLGLDVDPAIVPTRKTLQERPER